MIQHNARERRRDVRISPKGTVVVHASARLIHGRLCNLSRGGLSMVTQTAAPEQLLGSPAEIELRLDGHDARWLRLQGQIRRLGGTSIAVTFDAASPTFASVMDEMVHASHHHDRLLSVVLVDAMSERRSVMTTAFRDAGCLVIDVSTPLEAIVRLGESRFEPDLIAIADSFPLTISDELRRFVGAEHARAKLVTIGEGVDGPAGLVHWLSSADPFDDLATRIRKVLTTFER